MKKYILLLTVLITGIQLSAQIKESINSDSLNNFLDEVVITANKYPKKQSETGKVISVINHLEIEKSSGKSLGEILNSEAGIHIIGAKNNLGTNLTPSIRGSSAGNVLILLDGIPVNDPSVITNYFDLNFISPDQVERIEILKGGQSTLYGSDAVAGVINIISKKAKNDKINLSGNFASGSYNMLKQSLSISSKGKISEYIFNYTHVNADGFSAAYDSTKKNQFDKDGFNQHTLNSRFGLKMGKQIKAYFYGSYSRYKTDLDAAAFVDEKDFTVDNINKQGGFSFIYSIKKGTIQANYNYNWSERSYLDDSSYLSSPFIKYSKSRFTGKTNYAEIFSNWKLNHWEFLSGIDFRFNKTEQYSLFIFPGFPSPPAYLTAGMNQISPYSSIIYNSNKRLLLELGGRVNFHSVYGKNLSFTFNPVYIFKNKLKILGNLYSAYKAPTLFQLYDEYAGNNNLKPEKGIIGEFGAEIFMIKYLHSRIVLFVRNTKNAIVYTYSPSLFESKYKNAAQQMNYGTEIEFNYKKGNINLSANYTYTDGKTKSAYNENGNYTGKDTSYFNLYRIPKNTVNLNLGFQINKHVFVNTHIYGVSKRSEFIYGSLPAVLKSYLLADFYAEYNWDEKVKIFVDLKNILNKKYFDFLGYNARKFNFVTGMTFNLN